MTQLPTTKQLAARAKMSPQQRLIANARLRQDRAQAAMDFIRAERAKLAELPSSWVVEQKTHLSLIHISEPTRPY